MTATLNEVTAVIVTYNSAAVVGACLAGIHGLGRAIVVDNNSTDVTLEVVRRAAPEAQVLSTGANRGFGRGANAGLERVQTRFALLLNPDCVASPAAIETLLLAANRYPDGALFGPQLMNAQGRLESGFKTPLRDLTDREPPYACPAGDACSPCLTGAVYLMRMSLMRQVGFFDPAIFLYYEDDDLCLRVRRAGFSCILVPGAAMLHAVGRSTKPTFRSAFRRAFHFKRSHLYMLGKHHGLAARRAAVRQGIAYALPRLAFPSVLNYGLFVRCVGILAASLSDLFRPLTAPQPGGGPGTRTAGS